MHRLKEEVGGSADLLYLRTYARTDCAGEMYQLKEEMEAVKAK